MQNLEKQSENIVNQDESVSLQNYTNNAILKYVSRL